MNQFDADKLLGALARAPKRTQIKIENLIAESAAAHAAYSSASDSAREAWTIYTNAENKLLAGTNYEKSAGPDGEPQYSTNDRNGDWLPPIAARLQRLWRDARRLRDAADRLAPRWESFAILFDVKGWLADRGGAVFAGITPPAAKLTKGESHAEAVARVRAEIEALAARYAEVRDAPAPAAELIARQDAEIDRIAARGAVRFEPTRRDGAPFDLTGDGVRYHPEMVGLSTETVTWLFASEMKTKLAARITAAVGTAGMSDAERTVQMTRLAAEKLAAERVEEAHIVAAEEAGTFVARRRDADPRAVLEVLA